MRSVRNHENRNHYQLLLIMIAMIFRKSSYFRRICVKIPTRKGYLILPITNILRIETHSSWAKRNGEKVKNGDGNSTHVFTKCGGHYKMAKKISDWKKLFEGYEDFVQTHQAHIVNFQYVRSLREEDGTILELSNGDYIPVSRKHKENIVNRLYSGHYIERQGFNEAKLKLVLYPLLIITFIIISRFFYFRFLL